MRTLLGSLAVSLLLLAAPRHGAAACGDVAGDVAAVKAVVTQVLATCDCCGPQLRRDRIVSCPFRVVRAAVQSGVLRRACVRTALRRASRACRRTCSRTCTTDAQCDDGNGCTTDVCAGGRCAHACMCVTPLSTTSCCPGPVGACPRPTSSLHWFRTCGAPVCPALGDPIPGVAACTTQHEGDPCTSAGAECDPGFGCSVRLACLTHAPDLRQCPISRRDAKQKIAYLGAADVRRLHDQLMRLPLATYRYRSDTPDAPRRLGFVIDDVPASPAVGADRSMVDLYGYASMAVAALQEQDRKIARLERELTALRRSCRAR